MTNYTRINLGITKDYLVPCSGGYLLIDTGYETDYTKFRKELSKANIAIEDIKYLLLTHYHDDHSGFAAKLKKEYGIPLIVQRLSVPLLASGGSIEEDGGIYVTKRLRALFSIFKLFHKEFHFPPVIVDDNDFILDGDDDSLLKTLGVKAKIIMMPGHTDDSMSVLFDDGTAFIGDVAMSFLKFTGTQYRPIYYTNEEKMYSSIKLLIASGAKYIMPAHGNPFPVVKLKKMLRRNGQKR